MDFEEKLKKWAICLVLWFIVMFCFGWFFGVPVWAETVPVENGNVISGWFFEKRVDRIGNLYQHKALDFPANKYTPIRSVKGGRVVNADYHRDLGNYVDIFDGHGVWRYAHLQNYFVSIDRYIAEGEVFASVGSTGLRSQGPHVHLEYRVNGKRVFFTDKFGVKFKIIQSRLQK